MLQIAGGVTTVRDLGNQNDHLQDLIDSIDSGRTIGSSIVPVGFIEGASPHSARNGIVVASAEEAIAAIDWYAQRGYRQVKLYNSMRPEWIRRVAAHAHARGLRVSGHIPAFMRAEQAVRDGYDEIQHINQVMLNVLVTPQDDTRTLRRFTLVGDKAFAAHRDAKRRAGHRTGHRDRQHRDGQARRHDARRRRAHAAHRGHPAHQPGAERLPAPQRPAESDLRDARRAHAPGHHPRLAVQLDGRERSERSALPRLVRDHAADDRLAAPFGRDAARGHRQHRGLHSAPGARAVRAPAYRPARFEPRSGSQINQQVSDAVANLFVFVRPPCPTGVRSLGSGPWVSCRLI